MALESIFGIIYGWVIPLSHHLFQDLFVAPLKKIPLFPKSSSLLLVILVIYYFLVIYLSLKWTFWHLFWTSEDVHISYDSSDRFDLITLFLLNLYSFLFVMNQIHLYPFSLSRFGLVCFPLELKFLFRLLPLSRMNMMDLH